MRRTAQRRFNDKPNPLYRQRTNRLWNTILKLKETVADRKLKPIDFSGETAKRLKMGPHLLVSSRRHSSQVHRKEIASNHFPSAFSPSLAYHFGSLLSRDRQPLANSWSSYAIAEELCKNFKMFFFSFFYSSNNRMFNRNVTVKLYMLRLHV